jgi:hypothetical protein
VRKKPKLFHGYGFLFAFQFLGIEDKRMKMEEAESAEGLPGKPLGHFYLCVLRDLCGLFFYPENLRSSASH